MRVPTLQQFKSHVLTLLPKDGKIKSLEVYIGELTATQLGYLLELVSSIASGEMINILFWKVTFLQSESSTLDYMVERACE